MAILLNLVKFSLKTRYEDRMGRESSAAPALDQSGVRSSDPHPPFRSLTNFVHPNLPVSFGRDTKSCWSLISGVYARGSKYPTQGVNVYLGMDTYLSST